MKIQPAQFVDRDGRRVLTDAGKPGRDGVEDAGSTTDQMQGEIAAAIFAHAERMNNAQLEEIIGWVRQYKTVAPLSTDKRTALVLQKVGGLQRDLDELGAVSSVFFRTPGAARAPVTYLLIGETSNDIDEARADRRG